MKNTLLILSLILFITTNIQANYVNMGSSFAAGSGIKPHKKDGIKRCRQSELNYASLLAKRLNIKLIDRSCGGAKSIDLIKANKELLAQIDGVNQDTKLITISIGGNDLSYVKNLFALSCDKEKGFILNGKKYPCFEQKPVQKQAYMELENNLDILLKQLTTLAPKAKVIFIQYVSLIPKKLCVATPLSKEEAKQMTMVAKRLATITKKEANKHKAMVLPMDILSKDHTPCDKEPWSIGAMPTQENFKGMPWHPNLRANEVIAQKLQEMLEL